MTDSSIPSADQTTRFELQTRISRLDYVSALRAVSWTWSERAMGILPALSIACIGTFSAVMLLAPLTARLPASEDWWAIGIIVASGVTPFLLFNVFVLGHYIDSMYHGQPIGMGDATIVADLNGIIDTVAGIEVRVPWNKVQDVTTTDQHVFLRFSRLLAVIVPRRAFADDAEAQRFIEFARRMAPKPA
jgi:YcxB-like protein